MLISVVMEPCSVRLSPMVTESLRDRRPDIQNFVRVWPQESKDDAL